MDGIGLDIKADMLVHIVEIGGLNHPLESAYINDNFIMNTKEGNRGYNTTEHTLFHGDYVHVLGADNNVNLLTALKAAVQTVKNMAGEENSVILHHHAVKNITLTDEVGNKGVFRLVINIHGCADLLDAALRHYDNSVRHGKSFFLVMGNKNEGDTGSLLNLLQFLLHVLSQLKVESCQRLVQKQNLGLVDKGAGNGHTLLLAAGKAVDTALFKAAECNHGEHLSNLLMDFGFGALLLTQGEGHIFKNVQVREQGIALENGVYIALIGRNIVDILTHKDNIALVSSFKAADKAQSGGLAAAGGAQQSNKFIIVNVQTDIVQNNSFVIGFADVFKFYYLLHFPVSQLK